jgi:hypothetical protein
MYLKADPTLSPDRPKNFNAIPTEAEAKVLRFGPTPIPDVGEGLEHGCVWEPGFYGCDCKEITLGCKEASNACEVALQREEMAAPEAAKREFMASFDRTEITPCRSGAARASVGSGKSRRTWTPTVHTRITCQAIMRASP